MVVDDDFDVRAGVAEVLQDEGYTALVAADGAEALEQLHAGARPSLILLDLMMPRMDGEAFCRRWRADPALSDIPVFVLSADANTPARSGECGATGWIRKPVRLDDLLGVVARYAT